jgi:hypothetical protein
MLTVSAAECVRAGEPESLTVKVMERLLTGAAGVPEIAPVEAASDKPAGSDPPLTDHLYGDSPPEATSVALYAVPTRPAGSEVVVMLSDPRFDPPPHPWSSNVAHSARVASGRVSSR